MTAINTELLNKITILYIEDDYETRKNLVHESAKLFKKVYAETNGLDGLNTYKANKDSIDVIVSDLHSSILSGSELLKEIRLIHKDIPFIFPFIFTFIYIKMWVELFSKNRQFGKLFDYVS